MRSGKVSSITSTRNPATGMLQCNVTFVKRVVAYGLALLVGSGYYLEDEE